MKHQIRRIVVGALAVAMVSQAFVPSAAAGTGCAAKDLVPFLHSTTASQGLPYSPLVRGKKTIVRFYLTLPECASSSQWIKLSGARLSVGRGGSNESLGTVANKNSLSTPAVISNWDAPANDSQGDPFFAVPASSLAPASTTAAFDATFTADLSYITSFSSKAAPARFSFAAPVAQKTNNLRVLAIPMGDPTRTVNDTEVQFSSGFDGSAADTAVKGMGTLSRIFPVQQGTGSLADGTGGGIRYTLDLAGLVDVSEFMTEGTAPDAKFCGNGSNGSAVQGKLSNFLTQYNTANPLEKIADRVLGVIDGAVSASCFEGYAGIAAREAWARTVGGSTTAGSIIAMEEGHNSGAVSLLRASRSDRYHSQLFYGDATAPNRGYNTTTDSYLSDDRSVMRYLGQATGWGDDRTIFEKGDWEQAFCRLGGPITADCQITVPEGVAGAGAGTTTFNVVGLTDGTPGGTEILDSFLAPGPATQSGGSKYFFVQRAGSEILDSDPVPAEETHSGHDGTAPELREHPHKSFFSFSYDAHPSADRWELWNGAPDVPGSTLLTERTKADSSPAVGATSTETKTEDDRTINFDDGTPLDDPATRYAGRGVLFGPENDDESVPSLFADVTASSRPMTLVNDAALAGEEGVTPIGGPEPMAIRFTSPVEQVGMNIGNGLIETTATLVAYDGSGDELGRKTVMGFGKGLTTRLEIADAGLIKKVTLLYTDRDGKPSTQSEQIDDLSFTPGSGETYVATATATGQDPQNLRGAFFLRCPNQNLPIAVSLSPAGVEGNTATFEHSFTSAFACEDGGQAELLFRANDGFETTPFSEATFVDAPARAPLPAIESPTINASIVQHHSMALSGQAYDVSHGALPGSSLEWFVKGPDFPEQSVGTGNDLSVPAPTTNGGRWNPGTYQIRLKATGLDGQSSEAVAKLEVLKDEDNDGIPFEVERCFASTPDTNPDADPFNVSSDFDGDGMRNGDDPEPCVLGTSFVLDADFDPDNIYVPSSGNDFTYYISGNSNLTNVEASSVRISKVDGVDVSPADPLFNGAALSWQVGSDGVASAKFSRQAVTRYLERENLINKFVLFTITGTGRTGTTEWTFQGNDSPLVRPAS